MSWPTWATIMLHPDNKSLYATDKFKLHQWVKTTCRIYAGLQKDQRTKLTALPAGTSGEIRAIEQIKVDSYYAITYYLVRFPVSQGLNKKQLQYWAKLGESCLTE